MVQLTSQSELREALDYMKAQSGSGSKKRKQEKFREVYTASVGLLIAGERYDDAGIGPATAQDAVETAFPNLDVGEFPTISEALNSDNIVTDDAHWTEDTTSELVNDLDQLAKLSGNEQKGRLVELLEKHQEPSLVTLALLDDESFGLGTSEMRDAFFDGKRSERKRAEALTDGTVDFITRAKSGTLPDEPEVFTPFDPMLAKPESAGEPDNTVAQAKVDGWRLVVHVSNGQARAYTRRRKDKTHTLPELQEIDWPRGDYIFDCEVIAEDGTYKSTSERVGRGSAPEVREMDMEFAMFDLVYANGDMTGKPYKQRYQKLGKAVNMAIEDPRVYLLPASSNIDEVRKYALDEGYEGIILKDLHSEYELGTRSSSWVKEKHEREHIDARITDMQEGEGEAAGRMGKFAIETADGEPLGWVGTGFTHEQSQDMWDNQSAWIGGTVEVSAEAYDGQGDATGLRFPVFERDRREDGEPDSIDKVEGLLDPA